MFNIEYIIVLSVSIFHAYCTLILVHTYQLTTSNQTPEIVCISVPMAYERQVQQSPQV